MLNALGRAIGMIASLVLLSLVILTFADVIGRTFFNTPIGGATELMELGMVLIVFAMYPVITLQRLHISVDLLDTVTGPLVRRLQGVVAGVLGTLLFAGMAWRLRILGDRSWSYGETTAYIGISLGPVFWLMSVMSGITALCFLWTACQQFRRGNRRDRESLPQGLN